MKIEKLSIGWIGRQRLVDYLTSQDRHLFTREVLLIPMLQLLHGPRDLRTIRKPRQVLFSMQSPEVHHRLPPFGCWAGVLA